MAGSGPAMMRAANRPLPVRLHAVGIRRRRDLEFRFQRRYPRLQRLVFLARQAGHVLDGLELLALDHIEVAQDPLGLIAHYRIDLALDALGGAGGVVHQAADLVKKPVRGLGHLAKLSAFAVARTPPEWRSTRRGSRAECHPRARS